MYIVDGSQNFFAQNMDETNRLNLCRAVSTEVQWKFDTGSLYLSFYHFLFFLFLQKLMYLYHLYLQVTDNFFSIFIETSGKLAKSYVRAPYVLGPNREFWKSPNDNNWEVCSENWKLHMFPIHLSQKFILSLPYNAYMQGNWLPEQIYLSVNNLCSQTYNKILSTLIVCLHTWVR